MLELYLKLKIILIFMTLLFLIVWIICEIWKLLH